MYPAATKRFFNFFIRQSACIPNLLRGFSDGGRHFGALHNFARAEGEGYSMITSRQNSRIKGLAALQRKQARQETGLTIAEGFRITREALLYADPRTLVLSERLIGTATGEGLRNMARERSVENPGGGRELLPENIRIEKSGRSRRGDPLPGDIPCEHSHRRFPLDCYLRYSESR